VTNAETNFRQEATSSADGSFRSWFSPWSLQVSVTANGFRPFEESNIEVKVNDQLRFDVVLDVGNVNEKVEISANAVQVANGKHPVGRRDRFQENARAATERRSYIDLLGLQLGVAPSTSGSIQQDRASFRRSEPRKYSVNGQRRPPTISCNGGDVSEGRNLGAGLVPNLDSVEEFRLITNKLRRRIRKIQRRGNERNHEIRHQ